MKIVEQPVAGRPDIHFAVSGGGELGVSGIEDATRVIESRQQARSAAAPPDRQSLAPRDRARPFSEVLGTQQLTADRPGEQLIRRLGATREETGKEGRRRYRSDAGGHRAQDSATGFQIMNAFTVAAEMLGDMRLSPGQLAQLRAIDAKYQQRLFTLLNRDDTDADATGSPASLDGTRSERTLNDRERSDLEAVIRSDILDMLTPEQLSAVRNDDGARYGKI
jgi:hypothetical protein